MAALTELLDPEGAHIAALRRLAAFGDQRVLELGCGDGRLTLGIAKDAGHVLAVDPDADAVDRARRNLPAESQSVSPTGSRQERRSTSSRTRSTSWSSPGHSDESIRRTSCTSWVR